MIMNIKSNIKRISFSSDHHMSLKDGIRYYNQLLQKNKITIGGAAHKRLISLQKKQFDIQKIKF